MRKFIRRHGPRTTFALRKFLRRYGPPIIFIGLIYLGIEAFHAFIDYLKRTWDVGAALMAGACVISLYQGTWRIMWNFMTNRDD